MITYWVFHSNIKPYITVRGWEFLTPAALLQSNINYGIQMIYNKTRWDFNFTTCIITEDQWEEVTTWDDTVSYYIFDLDKHDHRYVLDWATGLRGSEMVKWYEEVKTVADLWQEGTNNKWMQWGNAIIIREKETVTLSFYKGYKFLDYNSEHVGSERIPLPSAFLPALDFLIKSNVDMIAVNTADGENVDNYKKYQSQITDLKSKNRWNTGPMTANIK